MARDLLSLYAVLGFASLGGGFAIGAVVALQPVPPPPFAPAKTETSAPEGPGPTRVTVPLEDQLIVAVAETPARVILTLAVTVHGDLAALVALKAEVEEKRAEIMAALLVAAQAEVAKDASPSHVLAALPAVLRDAANKILGTADLPDPVDEVLITGLIRQ